MSPYLTSVLFCAFLSMVPVIELRGAIIYGLSADIPLALLLPLCIFANLVPVPFVMAFLRSVLHWLQKRCGFLKTAADWLISQAEKKSEIVRKYELLGLFFLVAIPLPGTGAWTGAMVAGIMNMPIRKALPPIAAGVAVAGIIVTLISGGVIHIAGL